MLQHGNSSFQRQKVILGFSCFSRAIINSFDITHWAKIYQLYTEETRLQKEAELSDNLCLFIEDLYKLD